MEDGWVMRTKHPGRHGGVTQHGIAASLLPTLPYGRCDTASCSYDAPPLVITDQPRGCPLVIFADTFHFTSKGHVSVG